MLLPFGVELATVIETVILCNRGIDHNYAVF
jgi:hypothetical protein